MLAASAPASAGSLGSGVSLCVAEDDDGAAGCDGVWACTIEAPTPSTVAAVIAVPAKNFFVLLIFPSFLKLDVTSLDRINNSA